MKNLSRILTVLLCFAPVAYASASPVATTAGSNLTAFNPSNANNNQWATLSNGRYDSANAPKAKADFGNCNAVILRCAQPKCSNGGCAEASIAAAIVKGCVQSNSSCNQYGDDLVQYMTAQLVASSNAKINEQNLAAQQAAAAAVQQQSEQQMQQMQYQMQQMQQQMAQQQAESAQQLQEALAQQAAQNAAALESMKSVATEAAKENEAGVTAYQQEAIDRGISTDVIERQKVTGQIMTEIENAEVSLKEVKVAMNNAFEYAKCDARGNNCAGPKRIKKWRELAREFSDPYINTLEHFSEALGVAEVVGIDLSQIYMMLNDSCNRWGQFLCPQMKDGFVVYPDAKTDKDQKDPPKVCVDGDETKTCRPCTLIKVLTESKDDQDAVYAGWVDAEYSTSNGNATVVSCASGVLKTSKFLAPLSKRKNGANLVDMDMLELWLDQIGPDKQHNNRGPLPKNYCFAEDNNNGESMKDVLRKATLSKSVDTNKMYCDMKDNGTCSIVSAGSDNASFINPIYAICDAHQYNAGISAGDKLDSDKIAEIKEIVGLKTTVVSQQMYKQYEYLNATLRRLKTQLEKAALTATLETAGAKSEGGSSSGGLLGGNSNNDDKTIHLAGAENCANKMSSDAVYSCLQSNISLIISSAKSNTKNACKQLAEAINVAKAWEIYGNGGKIGEYSSGKDCSELTDLQKCNKNNVATCAQMLNVQVIKKKEQKSNQQQYRNYGGYSQQPNG